MRWPVQPFDVFERAFESPDHLCNSIDCQLGRCLVVDLVAGEVSGQESPQHAGQVVTVALRLFMAGVAGRG